MTGARGGAVGWGIALPAGRTRVLSSTVSFELIYPAALWGPEMSNRDIYSGGGGGGKEKGPST